MIEIKNVYKKLGGKEVLRGINLEVRDGELMVIMGGERDGEVGPAQAYYRVSQS